MSKDYYAILGVKKEASEDEIKKSFRRLAHEHHPDKGGDQQKFKDVNEAYQVLGDKEKRAKYDRFGSAAFDQGGFGQGFNNAQGFDFNGFGINDMGDLGDVFSDMFGFNRSGRRTKRGRDIETEVTLEFLESVKGVNKKIRIYKHDKCTECAGSGSEKGAKQQTCKTCGGQGAVKQATRTFFGTIQSTVTCPDCDGHGSKSEKPCRKCSGTGVEKINKELDVQIPAGIAEGEALKIHGEGEYPGSNGVAGDLFVRFNIRQHPKFTRENFDILSTEQVAYSIMVLGGEIEIETVDGPGSLRIPEGTQNGTVFKIRSKGFNYLRSNSRGDHLVTVLTTIPKKLSKDQKRKIEELRDLGF